MKKDKVLVLGSGKDLTQRLNTSSEAGPTFADNFEEVVTLDYNPGVGADYQISIQELWPVELQNGSFDEVHAYEVLHLVDGIKFFVVWKNIWNALKPGGLAFATVPWWESVWAFQDPLSRDVYSRERLQYLDQGYYSKPAVSSYNLEVWTPPYHFVQVVSQIRLGKDNNPKTAGYAFVLQKVPFEG